MVVMSMLDSRHCFAICERSRCSEGDSSLYFLRTWLANEKEFTFKVFFPCFYSATVSEGLNEDLGAWGLDLPWLGTGFASLPDLQNLFATWFPYAKLSRKSEGALL